MNDKFKISEEDLALFKTSLGKTKKIKQDTVVHKPVKPIKAVVEQQKFQQQQSDSAFYFSDEFQPLLQEDPIRYTREGADPYEVKKLRRGVYVPDLFLDLHGLTQAEAKQEIAALIIACRQEHVYCACIIYGHGKNILKKQTPMWLAQHPNVLCFHQAPKEFGGTAALLLLVDQDM